MPAAGDQSILDAQAELNRTEESLVAEMRKNEDLLLLLLLKQVGAQFPGGNTPANTGS